MPESIRKILRVNVLVVDDDLDLRTIIVDHLKDLVEDVIEAGDGEEAFRLMKQNPVDILITDIDMPKLNGLDLLEAIQKLSANVQPAVKLVVSGTAESDGLGRAMAAGANDYLVKPFSSTALLKRLEICIDSAREKKLATEVEQRLVKILTETFGVEVNSKFNENNAVAKYRSMISLLDLLSMRLTKYDIYRENKAV